METYDVQTNDKNKNRFVATFSIPDEVLVDIQQNPNDATIVMTNKNEFILTVKDKQYTVNNFEEKEVDFYALYLDKGMFEQVGTVQRKLMIKSKVDENLKQITKKKTEIFNRKDAKTEVIAAAGVKKSKLSTRKTKTPSTTAAAPQKTMIKDVSEKPHFSEDIKEKLKSKNKTIAPLNPPETKKRKRAEGGSTKKAKRKKDNGDNSDEEASNEAEDDQHEDLDDLLFQDMTGNASPPTNGSSNTQPSYVVPITSILEEQPLLDTKRIDLERQEPDVRKREIRDVHDYNSVKEEYRNKYEMYMLVDRKLLENKDLFKRLTDQYTKCTDSSEKSRIGNTLKQLFTVRQEEVKKLTNSFKIMHEELAQLKKLVATFVSSKR